MFLLSVETCFVFKNIVDVSQSSLRCKKKIIFFWVAVKCSVFVRFICIITSVASGCSVFGFVFFVWFGLVWFSAN